MQIEVKLSIDSAEGQERTAQTLANHHLKDECYYDFFFDFSYRALQERNSVLRLRVPCELSSVAAPSAPLEGSPCSTNGASSSSNTDHHQPPSHAASDSTEKKSAMAGRRGEYDPDAEYAAFLRACRGESAEADATDVLSSPTDSSTVGQSGAPRRRALPRPILVPGATGKLFLKQKNTIQHGHQMNFVAEDADVPAEVVEALVKLVPESLFITGVAAASTSSFFAPSSLPSVQRPANPAANAFKILSEYAERRPRTDDGAAESAIVRIVRQLADIARAFTPARASGGYMGKRARSESQESDTHFTQVRFAAMGARTAYTQRQRAIAEQEEEKEEEEEKDRTADEQQQQQQNRQRSPSRKSGSAAAAAAAPHVEAVGGFMTLRKIYAYTGVHQGVGETQPTSPRDTELRQSLRLRLDTSYLLPGISIYELEVPKCGVAVDDIAEEVSTFLRKLAVPFHTGSESKYARYVHFLDATRDVEHDAMDVKLRLTNVNGFEEVRRNLQQLTHAPTAAVTAAASSSSTSLLLRTADTPRSSQDRRYLSNTEIDPADVEQADDDTWWQTNPSGYLQETNEDFFFDSAAQTLRRGQTFLRLRKQQHLSKYSLVLKAHQVFSGGQQNSLSSKVEVSEVVAHALIDNPTQFLRDHCESFAMMKTIWDEFGVRELRRAATFTTERLTVPWWSATSQISTLQRSWANASAAGASIAPQSQPIYTSTSYYLSQQQQRNGAESGARQPPFVPPLLIHLDKTLYKLPADAKPARVPFSQGRPWADRQCETYEIEVTNIETSTDPKEVIRELTELLNGLGVEWSVGVRSKLEQYYSLIAE